MTTNNIVSFLIAGGILLLAFLLLINPLKINRKGNFYFGLFLMLWSTFWLDEAFDSEDFNINTYFIVGKGVVQFLAPLVFYLSIKFYTNPYFKLKRRLGKLLVFPIFYLFILFYETTSTNAIVNLVPSILIIVNALFYTVLAYLSIQKHQKDIESIISNKEPVDLNWIKNIIYAIVGSTIIAMLYNTFIDAASLNLYINMYFLAVVYMIAYFSIKQREIYPEHLNINEIVNTDDSEDEQQNIKLLINNEELEVLKGKLLLLMKTEKPYLDSELNLIKLAEKLSLSTHHLSFIINSGFSENFFQFINKYKVQKAKELLNNPKYDNYTILAIGFESGFNSKTAFNTTFKKVTSYTPTEYRKIRSDL
jgi:AraC-like DNA-binding protein